MDISNLYPSEVWRRAAEKWVDLDSAARVLESTKSAVLAQRMSALGDIPASHAEREVKATPFWEQHVRQIEHARTAANKAKVEMEFQRMKVMEWQSENATKRAEMRL